MAVALSVFTPGISLLHSKFNSAFCGNGVDIKTHPACRSKRRCSQQGDLLRHSSRRTARTLANWLGGGDNGLGEEMDERRETS